MLETERNIVFSVKGFEDAVAKSLAVGLRKYVTVFTGNGGYSVASKASQLPCL
jgi:hypothetical protein